MQAETIAEMFQKILHALGLRVSLEKARDFATQFTAIQQNITAAPHAAATLKQLKGEGYTICILTDSFFSAKEKWAWFKTIGIDSSIDTIVSSYDIRKLKDSPEAYQACLGQLNTTAEESLFVGHQQYEMDGAHAAHITSIAVTAIASSEIKADYTITVLSELPALVQSLTHKRLSPDRL